jgi:hypothetical protein|eukprot:COSAG01_NODE_388_length_17730_cov_13.231978_7_plen_51_part_00
MLGFSPYSWRKTTPMMLRCSRLLNGNACRIAADVRCAGSSALCSSVLVTP